MFTNLIRDRRINFDTGHIIADGSSGWLPTVSDRKKLTFTPQGAGTAPVTEFRIKGVGYDSSGVIQPNDTCGPLSWDAILLPNINNHAVPVVLESGIYRYTDGPVQHPSLPYYQWTSETNGTIFQFWTSPPGDVFDKNKWYRTTWWPGSTSSQVPPGTILVYSYQKVANPNNSDGAKYGDANGYSLIAVCFTDTTQVFYPHKWTTETASYPTSPKWLYVLPSANEKWPGQTSGTGLIPPTDTSPNCGTMLMTWNEKGREGYFPGFPWGLIVDAWTIPT